MRDEKKSRAELMEELGQLRRRVAELESLECERTQPEEALRNSEALYHSLVESIPMNVFRKDLEGKFTFSIKLFCETLRRPL